MEQYETEGEQIRSQIEEEEILLDGKREALDLLATKIQNLKKRHGEEEKLYADENTPFELQRACLTKN